MIASALPVESARRLRVMHVILSLGGGGAERIVCDQARHRRDRLELHAVCLDGLGALANEAASMGVGIHCTHRRPGVDWRQAATIAACIRRIRPDVIHAHHYSAYLYAALGAARAGFGPIVLTEHGRHFPDVVSPARRAFNQLLRLRRDRLVAVSHHVAEALRRRERLAARDVEVIYNGIDTSLYRPGGPAGGQARRALAALADAPPQAPLLVQVGRLAPVKDHATSLRAMADLLRTHPAARLVLLGNGPLQGDLERLARELGIAAAVRFAGRRDDVPFLLGGADVFVNSSRLEGACLAILEAMAVGLPVAATDAGGNPELVAHGHTGLISPPGDPPALAANLRALLDDADRRRFGLAGRQRVEARFEQRDMHAAYERLYERMPGVRASGPSRAGRCDTKRNGIPA